MNLCIPLDFCCEIAASVLMTIPAKMRFRVFGLRPSNLGLFGSSLQARGAEKREEKIMNIRK
jgi:hypothetical protein